MPRIYGRVLMNLRASLGVSQVEIATWAGLQQATVSNLERAGTILAMFHLDLFAVALSDIAHDRGQPPPCTTGWEIAQLATNIGTRFEGEGYTQVWAVRSWDLDKVVPNEVFDRLMSRYWREEGR